MPEAHTLGQNISLDLLIFRSRSYNSHKECTPARPTLSHLRPNQSHRLQE